MRRYLRTTKKSQLLNDLKTSSVIGDTAYYVKHHNRKNVGTCGSCVDNSLNAGQKEFQQPTEKHYKDFESKPRVLNCFDFYETQIETDSPFELKVSRTYSIKNLNIALLSLSFEKLRLNWALSLWMGHTWPDLLCHANEMAQLCEQIFSSQCICNHSALLKWLRTVLNLILHFKRCMQTRPTYTAAQTLRFHQMMTCRQKSGLQFYYAMQIVSVISWTTKAASLDER